MKWFFGLLPLKKLTEGLKMLVKQKCKDPETVAHINPVTKEIKHILKGEQGPREVIDDFTSSYRLIKREIRYIPYTEYLESNKEVMP